MYLYCTFNTNSTFQISKWTVVRTSDNVHENDGWPRRQKDSEGVKFDAKSKILLHNSRRKSLCMGNGFTQNSELELEIGTLNQKPIHHNVYEDRPEATSLRVGPCHTHLGNRRDMTKTRDVSVTNPAGLFSSLAAPPRAHAGPRVAKSSALSADPRYLMVQRTLPLVGYFCMMLQSIPRRRDILLNCIRVQMFVEFLHSLQAGGPK